MNTIVKRIAAAATAFALAAAVTLSAADAPTAFDVAAIDMSAAEYAVDMGADFAAEDNTQVAIFFWLIVLIVTSVAASVAGAVGTTIAHA